MNPIRILLAVTCIALAPCLLATSVSSDIIVDTTWNNAGSPYVLNAAVIKVRAGATLTIDSSGGNVEVQWSDGDQVLQVGNGSGNEGFLDLNAASGTVKFRLWSTGNIVVNPYGQVTTTDSTAATYFENYGAAGKEADWGALDFEAGQQFQSCLINCYFSGGGFDGKDAALVVRDTADNTPLLEDLSFDDCNVSAIRFDGEGVNTLRQNGIKLPLSVTNTDFVFYLNEVTSTDPVRFPDPTLPDAPEVKLVGTCSVGDASNTSHWRFDDAYTFKCAASSKISVVNGSVWGTQECRPLFEASSGTSSTHWVGMEDASAKPNVFGGVGPFACITVRNASTGVDLNKGTSYVPEAGFKTSWRFPGLSIKKCGTGLRIRTHINTGSADAGYTTVVEDADVGGSTSADSCTTGVVIDYGRVVMCRCTVNQVSTTAISIGTTSVGNTSNVTIRECAVDGNETAATCIYAGTCQGNAALLLDRTICEGAMCAVRLEQSDDTEETPTRSLAASHCFLSAYPTQSLGYAVGLLVNVMSTSVCTINVEDCTLTSQGSATVTGVGIQCAELRSASTMLVNRCTIASCTDYGVLVVSDANNTCEYTFLECSITGNGGSANEGGIHDARTQNAKVVATRCTVANNSPYNAYDADNTALMDAEDCYWGSDAGPGATINANVDGAPYLERPYIGWLIGGSPAGVSSLHVENGGPSFPDQFHIIDTDTLDVYWTVASDFAGQSQSAYELDLDDDPAFGSLTHDGSKQALAAECGEVLLATIAPTLAAGTVYYVRIRLWDANDRSGPWYYHTFRTNTAPPQIGDTSRTPTNTAVLTDWTPVLVWQRPTDADEDSLHFEVYVEEGATNYTVRSWTTSTNSASLVIDARACFEVSTDGGTTWLPLPEDGAPAGETTLVRLTWPDAYGLADKTGASDWDWKVRAWDGFEFGSYSNTWDFELGRSYTISGQLQDNAGTGLNGKTMRLYINGVNSGDTDVTATDVVAGRFDIVTTDALEVGDVLWVYLDDDGNDSERCAAAFHFTGDSITYDDDIEDIVLRDERVYIYGTVADLVFSNADFQITTADADIPWTYSGGDVTFKSDLDGSGDGVHLAGQWDLSGDVDGTTSLDVELTIATSGHLRTQGNDASFHKLTNNGALEIVADSRLTLDGANSTSSGTLIVRDGKLRLKKSGGLSLTIDNGVCELVRAELDVDTGDVSSLVVDSGASQLAVLSCSDSSFSKVGLVVEADGVVAMFNGNTFEDGISTRHIYWKTTDTRSTRVMRGIQFDYALTQGSQFNVEADASAIALQMIGCGGVRWGEGYDKDGGSEGDALDDLVLWELTPPTDLKITAGDTRMRLEWSASDQAALTNAGYNVYRTTNPADSVPWGSPLNGGTPITATSYNDSSLSNGTTYYYYVTVIDTNPTPDAESGGSNRVNAAPAASEIDEIAPASTAATSVLALTVLGENTHWTSGMSVTITKSGGSEVTVNDKVVISSELVLVDVTLSGATTGTWTVTTTENDVWGISAYDEVETADLTVTADDPDESDRPTLVFSTNNSGIAADANTSGAFVLNIDFTDNGNGIDTTKFEAFVSRDFAAYFGGGTSNITPDMEIVAAGIVIETLNDSRATWTVEQVATMNGEEMFNDGEHIVYARVADDQGNYSEWTTLRFYVEGAAADVAKTTTLLYQGDTAVNVVISGTFSTTVDGVDFGTGITTVSYSKDSGTQVTATVTVDETAACGPRTFTVDMTTGTDPAGIVVVEYPTNILPTTTNAEPSRNPAVGGINVFLNNGAFFKSETDIATRGRMMGMSWSRFYRSDIAFNGPLGHNWVGHYFQRAFIDTGSSDIHWYTPDGRKEVFPDVTGGYSSPVGVYVRAESESTHNTVTLTDRHGYQCVFNADGRLWKCIDRNGNVTECTYNNLGQLVGITDDLGRAWEIEYYAHGRVHKVIDKVWDTSTPREIEYIYDSNGDLTEQKAPTTARYDGTPLARITYGYGYDSAHRLTTCINPREFAESANPVPYLENFYDSTGRVVDQKLGDEADVQDSHLTKSAFIRLRYESGTLIRELDRNGLRTDYTIDGSGRATDIKRYTAFWSVDTDYPYTHSTVSQVVAKLRSTDPSYFQTVLTYNSNHEVLTVTYPRGNKVAYTYPSGSSQAAATADSCSGAVLTDSGESWTTDEFAGMTLRMGTSAANYRYYPIASNTSNTITVETGFDLQADGWNADAYAIYDESNDPLAVGNVVSVTRSDEGLGSLSDLVTEYTYESRYQFVKTATNPRGYATTYTYDYEESAGNGGDAGNLVKVVSPNITGSMPSGTITSRTSYNEFGQPVTSIDGEGFVSRFIYYTTGDNNGYLKQRITDWGGLNLTSEYEYNKAGDMTGSWPPRAFEAGVTKDDFKFVAEVNELGQSWHTTRKLEVGTSGALSLVSVDTYHYFDANGNRTNTLSEYITDAATAPSAPGDVLDPTSFPKASTAMAATWRESSATYNLLNYTVTSTQDAIAGSAITQYTTRVEYDSNYNTLASISPLGNRSHTVYDERDMVYQRIAGANSDVAGTFEADYDANGNAVASRDALGNESVSEFDGFDRLITSTDPAGHYREFDYDANGNTTESRAYDTLDALLAQSQSTFDEIDRAYTSRRLALDHLGNPIGDGWSTNTTVFDHNSRVVSSTNDSGITYHSFYDGANRTTYTRDAAGNESHFEYNANGAVKKVNYREINGLDNAVEISHTENVLTKQDSVVEYRDRRYTVSTFDTSTKRKYDGWGRVTVSYDAAGNTVTTNYDLLSRAIDTLEEAGTDDIYTRFEYDDDSRTTLRGIKRNPGASTWQETTYEYDERSRLITQRRPDAGTTGDIWTYQYDANGNRLGWTDPMGTQVTNSYDERNLVSYRHITRGTGIKGATYESYAFDGLGRLQSCSNYEGSNLISASAWQYNTLSMPERHDQTIADQSGGILGTWTSGAEYDGSGFNTATIYSDGHRLTHVPDQLNRTLSSYDETENTSIATYLYAGARRLVERNSGNGVRTNYAWEASGCGCGGSSSFCERVEHIDPYTGEVLFATDRRYDERGLVTVDRRDHEGAFGSVYRYDAANRLTASYVGTDLYNTALATYADQGNTPTTFAMKRGYDLDPRGNRTEVSDSDDSPGTVYDYAYTANADTNQYTAVDGANYTYDAIEQMTYDPSTNLYHAYDYKGQLVATDNDSALTSPERLYSYDCQGRRKRMTEAYNPTVFDICYISPVACASCSCDGSEDMVGEVQTLSGSTGSLLAAELNFWGPEVESPGSSSAVHPATVAMPSSGRGPGNAIVAQFVINVDAETDFWRFLHHDQHGSTIGVTDLYGWRTDEYSYTDYGQTSRLKIMFDGQDSRISSLQADTPSAGFTTINLTSADPDPATDEFNGKLLRIARPGAASQRLIYAKVEDTTTTSIIVEDVDDDVYDALNGVTQGFTILDQAAVTADAFSFLGAWSANPTYDGGSDTTTFTDTGGTFGAGVIGLALFPDRVNDPEIWAVIVSATFTTVTVAGDLTSYAEASSEYAVLERGWVYDSGSDMTVYFDMVNGFPAFAGNWTFVPNIEKPCHLQAQGVDGNLLYFKGDTRNLADPETDRYMLLPPAGVSATTGAYAKPEDLGENDYTDRGTMWLWSGYLYVTPQVGHDVNGTTYGAQSGTNKVGSYHCWNRVYEPATGRWTTPDPAASPSTSLWDYVASNPTTGADSSGLEPHKCLGILSLDHIHYADTKQDCNWLKRVRDNLLQYKGSNEANQRRHTECTTWLNDRIYEACGKGAPGRTPRPGTSSLGEEAKSAFRKAEERYARARIDKRVQGWSALKTIAEVVGTAGTFGLPALTGCGGGAPVTGPSNVVCPDVSEAMATEAKNTILAKAGGVGPSGVGDAGHVSACVAAFLNMFGNSLRSTSECCNWVTAPSGPQAVIAGKSCLESLSAAAPEPYAEWRRICAGDVTGGQPGADQFATSFMGK
ncbi:MAG: hypothetical protein IPK87_00075 [Planctomycetes bacterium]|nr:hypothetical protein [Planctomycetota bacterium]